MGDQENLPIEEIEVQQRRLHTKSQPLEQLDEVIEGIRRLMLSSVAETAINGKMKNKEPTRAVGKKEQ
jgi:hypothetical protein